MLGRQAASDLGICVVIPLTLTQQDGEVEFYEGCAIDFGGPKGAVFGRIDDRENSRESHIEAGYCASDLSDRYRRYDRQLFVDTLDDWKGFGRENEQPGWYTEKKLELDRRFRFGVLSEERICPQSAEPKELGGGSP